MYPVSLLWCHVCTFYWVLRMKRYAILPKRTDLHIQQHIHQKHSSLLLTFYDYAKVIVELEKKQANKEFGCVMVFIIRQSRTFQFVFGFNECLWENFSLLNFEKFWLYIWVVVVLLLILQHKWFRVTSSPMLMNLRLECRDRKYIPKCC